MHGVLERMFAALPFLVTTAFAGDLSQELTWEVRYGETPIGTRTVSVKYVPEENGLRRIIEGMTQIDATPAGFPYTYRQRLTAHASDTPASFHSVVEEDGEPREIQGRLTTAGWMITIVERGRSRSWDLGASELTLSTADLVDPASRVPLSRFDKVKVLFAETGDVWEGDVRRLGLSEVEIDGVDVPVIGFAIDPPQGRATFYYTTDGVLVRNEYTWMGRTLQAVLTDPPPVGVDDVPIGAGTGIVETELP